MARYRFLDAMGDVLAEGQFDHHAAALDHASNDSTGEDGGEPVNRVEYLGDEGDWRWAGPLQG